MSPNNPIGFVALADIIKTVKFWIQLSKNMMV
jgi:hypothetical protein